MLEKRRFLIVKRRFLVEKRRFLIGKTAFYYLYSKFRMCLMPVNNSSRHAPNHNLFELTEVELP